MFLACKKKRLNVVKSLIENHGYDLETRHDGYNLYQNSCFHENIDVIDYLENEYDFLNKMSDDDKHSSLFCCIYGGKLKMFKHVVKTINDKNGNDLYLLAVSEGNVDIMKYLEEEHNWNILVVNKKERNAYILAAGSNRINVLKYLEGKHDWEKCVDIYEHNAYLYAVRHEKIDVLEYLKNEVGWNTSIRDRTLSNSYHIACIFGKLKSVEYLDDDLNSRNIYGYTPFMLATRFGYLDIIKYFENKDGNDIYAKCNGGNNVYMIACIFEHFNVIKYFDSKYNFDRIMKNSHGHNILHYIENEEILEYLFSMECDKTFIGHPTAFE